jgi:hypothetical protein
VSGVFGGAFAVSPFVSGTGTGAGESFFCSSARLMSSVAFAIVACFAASCFAFSSSSCFFFSSSFFAFSSSSFILAASFLGSSFLGTGIHSSFSSSK